MSPQHADHCALFKKTLVQESPKGANGKNAGKADAAGSDKKTLREPTAGDKQARQGAGQGRYNPAKGQPLVKVLDPVIVKDDRWRQHFKDCEGQVYSTCTPVRKLRNKTSYHVLKPTGGIRKAPRNVRKVPGSFKKLPASSQKVLQDILVKPRPEPIKPRRFKAPAPVFTVKDQAQHKEDKAPASAQATVDKKELIPLVEADRAKKAAEEKALAQRIRRQSIRRFAKRLTKGRQNTATQELQEIEELVTKYGKLGVIGARLIFF